jgi:hypothetical protein
MAWEKDCWGEIRPVWKSEPSLGAIHKLSEALLDLPVEVKILAQGGMCVTLPKSFATYWCALAFNKLYTVSPTDSQISYVMLVSLPVHPRLKGCNS